MPSAVRTVATVLVGAATAAAHGIVLGVFGPDNEFHQGWDSREMGYDGNYPDVIGWSTTEREEGFVSKEDYSTPDIICHRGAKPATLSVEVAAGDVVTLEWDDWPQDHHGPVMDYLAPCGGGGCAKVDKESLEFFKISEVGCEKPGMGDDGVWATDLLIDNDFKWQVMIPEGLAPGEYVLRHEILALHEPGQPQHYPQCVNIKVTGGDGGNGVDGVDGEDEVPAGIPATELYEDYEDFDIYAPFDSYPIPGPAMIAGASPILHQGTGKPDVPAGRIEGATGDYYEGTPLLATSTVETGAAETAGPEATGPPEVPELEDPAEPTAPSTGGNGGSCLARRKVAA